jgi:hypothetical protein
MGNSSSSSVTNKILNKSINKSDIEAINEQVSNFITNRITKSAAICSQSSTVFQDVEIGNITASGVGSNISGLDISQDATVNISLSCLQTSVSQINISNDIATAIVNSVSSSVSQSALSKAITEAETSSKTGMGATAMGNQTNSEVNVDMQNIQENETTRKFVNAVSNTVANTVSDETVKQAIQSQLASQSISVKNITASGGATIGNITFTQKSIASAISKAIQETQTVSTVVTKLASTYGLMSSETTTQTTSTDSSAKGKTVSTAGGLEDVVSAVGDAISKVFGSVALMYAVCGIVIVCILVGCIYALSKSFSSPSDANINPDAGLPDAGLPDAGLPDADLDANMNDANMNDANMNDANMNDANINPDAGLEVNPYANVSSSSIKGGFSKFGKFSGLSLRKIYYQSGKLFKNNTLINRKYIL